MTEPAWQFWIDRGGTFTDVVGAARRTARWSPTSCCRRIPSAIDDAALAGHPRPAGPRARRALPAAAIDAVKMGTTVATNALLERKGERTVLVDHQGLRRRAAHRLSEPARSSSPATSCCPSCSTSASSRSTSGVTAEGEVLRAARSRRQRARDLAAAFAAGIRSLAIVLMHGYRYPEHERRVAALAREIGFTQISVEPSRSAR